MTDSIKSDEAINDIRVVLDAFRENNSREDYLLLLERLGGAVQEWTEIWGTGVC